MSRPYSRFLPALAALSTIPLIVLTGCGAATSFSNPTASARVAGKVFGGQQPVVGSTVSVWAAGITGYGSSPAGFPLPLVSTTTAEDGTFNFGDSAYVCTPGEQVYITASGGTSVAASGTNANIMLATGLGDCATAQTATVEINEVTTAVTAFALAQFFTPTVGSSSTDAFGTDPADITAFTNSNQYTIPTLIDIPTGTVKPNTPSITIEAAKIYSLANTLAACVNDAAGFANCGTLYADTTPTGAAAPTDTLQAAVQIARNPYLNVLGLYTLATKTSPFTGLSSAPNDWTIGVSYTSSAYGLSIAATPASATTSSATSATIDIDAAGNIWFPTNLSGSTGVGYFAPTGASFSGPYITGTLIQPQYVAIDNGGLVWVTDEAAPLLGVADTTNPAGDSYAGVVDSSVLHTGPISGDGFDNILFAYTDTGYKPDLAQETGGNVGGLAGAVFTYPPTGLDSIQDFYGAATSGSSTPCGNEAIELNGDSSFADYVDNATSGNCTSGGFTFAQGVVDGLAVLSMSSGILSAEGGVLPLTTFDLPQGIATDGFGNEWVANAGNASVATFGGPSGDYAVTSPVPYLHDASDGNTMIAPYAIAIDGSGNVWIANAGCVTTSTTPCTPGAFVLSELIGAAGPTINPLSAQMIDNGYFVGYPPGTPLPPEVSAHPHLSGTRRYGPSSQTTSPTVNTKPLIWRR